MDIKILNSKQVRWAQELSRYHFRIDYCQGKGNRAADALSCFSQTSDNKKEKFQADNSQILHWLQFSLINASLSSFCITSSNPSPLHQALIYATHVLPQLR